MFAVMSISVVLKLSMTFVSDLWLLRCIYHRLELAKRNGIERSTHILTLSLQELLLIFDILLLKVKGHDDWSTKVAPNYSRKQANFSIFCLTGF